DLDDVGGGLEAHLALADAERGARPEEDVADAQVADEGAALRAEVAQTVAVVVGAGGDLEVGARHTRVGEDGGVGDAAAPREAGFAHLPLAPGVGPADDHELGLAQAANGGPAAALALVVAIDVGRHGGFSLSLFGIYS